MRKLKFFSMKSLRFFTVALLLAFAAYYALEHSYRAYPVFTGKTMGTYYMVKINAPRVSRKVHRDIVKVLKKVNRQMSVFDKNSEISKINAAPAGEWIKLTPEMSELFKTADRIYKESNGSFDPTVGKLVDLWGFGPEQRRREPSAEEIAAVLPSVGFDKLEFTDDYTLLRKKAGDITLNLSAIAKGYGVDRVAKLLKSMNFNDFVVDLGGEVRASGNRVGETTGGWRVGVQEPDDSGRNAEILQLVNLSAATSGDYRNYREDGAGHRYAHTISATTGKPVENNLASVTVLTENCIDADAYATAVMAMGPEQGQAFAKKLKLPLIMLIRNNKGDVDTLTSPAFKKYMKVLTNGKR